MRSQRGFGRVVMASLLAWVLVLCQPAVVAAQTGSAPIWLMGEVHDHPLGHAYRLADLKRELGGSWRPAILMEQFDVQRQAQLTHAWQTCEDAQCVIAAAGGDGWQWPFYEPLIQLALDYRLPLVAANVSRAQLGEVMKHGFEAVFDDQAIQQYGLNQPLPDAWLQAQRQAMRLGHCNLLPESMIDPMVKAQATRDIMYAQLLAQYASQGAVVIAGNGHVRKDLGIYVWLPQALRDQVTVFAYVESDAADALAYDRIRLMPAHERGDPCETFRRAMQQRGASVNQ
jgi:uncharacterized iron-regulated protein